jgi:hypothetical protein
LNTASWRKVFKSEKLCRPFFPYCRWTELMDSNRYFLHSPEHKPADGQGWAYTNKHKMNHLFLKDCKLWQKEALRGFMLPFGPESLLSCLSRKLKFEIECMSLLL